MRPSARTMMLLVGVLISSVAVVQGCTDAHDVRDADSREPLATAAAPVVGSIGMADGGVMSPQELHNFCPVGSATYSTGDGAPRLQCADFTQAACECASAAGVGHLFHTMNTACCPSALVGTPDTWDGGLSGNCGAYHAWAVVEREAWVTGTRGFCAIEPQWMTATESGVNCCWDQASGPPVAPIACARTAALCKNGETLRYTFSYPGCVAGDSTNFYALDGGATTFQDATGIPTDETPFMGFVEEPENQGCLFRMQQGCSPAIANCIEGDSYNSVLSPSDCDPGTPAYNDWMNCGTWIGGQALLRVCAYHGTTN